MSERLISRKIEEIWDFCRSCPPAFSDAEKLSRRCSQLSALEATYLLFAQEMIQNECNFYAEARNIKMDRFRMERLFARELEANEITVKEDWAFLYAREVRIREYAKEFGVPFLLGDQVASTQRKGMDKFLSLFEKDELEPYIVEFPESSMNMLKSQREKARAYVANTVIMMGVIACALEEKREVKEENMLPPRQVSYDCKTPACVPINSVKEVTLVADSATERVLYTRLTKSKMGVKREKLHDGRIVYEIACHPSMRTVNSLSEIDKDYQEWPFIQFFEDFSDADPLVTAMSLEAVCGALRVGVVEGDRVEVSATLAGGNVSVMIVAKGSYTRLQARRATETFFKYFSSWIDFGASKGSKDGKLLRELEIRINGSIARAYYKRENSYTRLQNLIEFDSFGSSVEGEMKKIFFKRSLVESERAFGKSMFDSLPNIIVTGKSHQRKITLDARYCFSHRKQRESMMTGRSNSLFKNLGDKRRWNLRGSFAEIKTQMKCLGARVLETHKESSSRITIYPPGEGNVRVVSIDYTEEEVVRSLIIRTLGGFVESSVRLPMEQLTSILADASAYGQTVLGDHGLISVETCTNCNAGSICSEADEVEDRERNGIGPGDLSWFQDIPLRGMGVNSPGSVRVEIRKSESSTTIVAHGTLTRFLLNFLHARSESAAYITQYARDE